MPMEKYQELKEEWDVIKQNLLEQGFSKYKISKIISEDFGDPQKDVENYLYFYSGEKVYKKNLERRKKNQKKYYKKLKKDIERYKNYLANKRKRRKKYYEHERKIQNLKAELRYPKEEKQRMKDERYKNYLANQRKEREIAKLGKRAYDEKQQRKKETLNHLTELVKNMGRVEVLYKRQDPIFKGYD